MEQDVNERDKNRQGKYFLVPAEGGDRHQYDWGDICWMVSAAQGNSTEMTLGKVTIKAGMSNGRHCHPNCDEILYLISGQLEHWVGADSFAMRPGDTVAIRAGEPHQALARGTERAVMMVAYSSASRQIEHED